MHNQLFVFDIETIPDTALAHALTGCESDDITLQRQALEQYHLEITQGKNSFLRQPFHRVVAISFLKAEIQREGNQEHYVLQELRTGGNLDSSEKQLVEGFYHHLGKMKARLVSFNGRTFDLPVLKFRAMHHGISAPWVYQSGDKWNSYTQRYSLDWHCDLMDGLSDFGASSAIKMNEACVLLGLPGKLGTDGGDVMKLFDQGKLQEIRNYCETDVMNTYLLYLHFMYHRGTLSPSSLEQCLNDAVHYLQEEGQQRPHLKEFLEAWR
ncbi:MAG: 3'-5' exonuclease [Alphaproteobacteria bacterium]|nr:3'-5' exonuclease [Alphaproteobacteria bacterium]